MATIVCGINHEDTKYTDKWSNKKTKTTQKQSDETTNKHIFEIL
jgi:hypothetical protein